MNRYRELFPSLWSQKPRSWTSLRAQSKVTVVTVSVEFSICKCFRVGRATRAIMTRLQF